MGQHPLSSILTRTLVSEPNCGAVLGWIAEMTCIAFGTLKHSGTTSPRTLHTMDALLKGFIHYRGLPQKRPHAVLLPCCVAPLPSEIEGAGRERRASRSMDTETTLRRGVRSWGSRGVLTAYNVDVSGFRLLGLGLLGFRWFWLEGEGIRGFLSSFQRFCGDGGLNQSCRFPVLL